MNGDNGKENGHYFGTLGLYWDSGKQMEGTMLYRYSKFWMLWFSNIAQDCIVLSCGILYLANKEAITPGQLPKTPDWIYLEV